MTNLLKSVEFIFVPFVNPDGYIVSLHLPCMSVTIVFFVVVIIVVFCYYCCFLLLLLFLFIVCCCCYWCLLFVVIVALSHLQYTWSNDRLWRKNRRKGILCDGVDLNRNYNSKWGGVSYPASLCFTPVIATCTLHRGVALVQSAARLTMDPVWNLNQRHRTQSTISSKLHV